MSALFCLGLSSCNKYDIPGMIVGSSPAANARFAESAAYNAANGFKTISVPGNEYTFYVASDAHLSGTSEGLTRFVDICQSDRDAAPFALYLGDALDGKGDFDCFCRVVAPIGTDGRTLFCTPGNHDINFGLWTDYIKMNGTSTYIFEVATPSEGRDLFICLDSSSGTLGTDQRRWLGETLSDARGKYRHIIVFTHTHFFKISGLNVLSSTFILEECQDLEKLFSDSGVELVLSGHDHSFAETCFKDVRYLTLASVSDDDGQHFYSIDVNSYGFQIDSY